MALTRSRPGAARGDAAPFQRRAWPGLADPPRPIPTERTGGAGVYTIWGMVVGGGWEGWGVARHRGTISAGVLALWLASGLRALQGQLRLTVVEVCMCSRLARPASFIIFMGLGVGGGLFFTSHIQGSS